MGVHRCGPGMSDEEDEAVQDSRIDWLIERLEHRPLMFKQDRINKMKIDEESTCAGHNPSASNMWQLAWLSAPRLDPPRAGATSTFLIRNSSTPQSVSKVLIIGVLPTSQKCLHRLFG